MSLRTKILAAVVGLNLLVLLLGVVVLLAAPPSSPGVPSGLVVRVQRLASDGVPSPVARDARLREVLALRREEPDVLGMVLLEEGEDALATPRPVTIPGLEPAAADVARAIELHREARKQDRTQVRAGELAMLLSGGIGEAGVAYAEGRRQGLYVRWDARAGELSSVRALYFTLLGGLLLVTGVAWTLLSRLVVRPLAILAEAASRVAGGDRETSVPTSGTGDEFDRTAMAFNRMAREVAEHQSHLESRVLDAIERSRKAERHLVIAQRLASTGKLASGIAHEINNPLGGMRNAVRALARGDLDAAKTEEYLDLVQDGLARIEDTVKKILSFTPRAVQARATDLADVARRAVALARHRIERRGLRLVTRGLDGAPVPVFGDPHELAQVALNLLLNAGDAIPDPEERGAPRPRDQGVVEVEVLETADHAVLRVTDDGVGMTPEVAAQCFDLFFTTKEVGEGTGLGLAVVHNIVTNHGGRIELDTAPGRGTTFRVLLPREPSPSEGADGVGGAGGRGASAPGGDAPGPTRLAESL